ncbi:unnamed protein product [Paramecium octaurelia]|uniref:Protein kinase domain-containing protein n=1 Tax=Paramecium octaurelia TaxID=43137 RepID=A0A8S1UTS2_PAROT|nr:unnamed protein product [Paramecium octaurelia]
MEQESNAQVLNDYVINKNNPIGSGLNSTVFKAKHVDTNKYVALKLLRKQTHDNNISKEMISKIYQQEVQALQLCNQLNSKNIVRLFSHFENCNEYVLVLELCEQSLMEYLQQKSHLKEEEALDIFGQIYRGLSYLQNQKYYHRDIKPSNIMIKDSEIKIIDFGFCKQIIGVDNLKQHTRCGTFGYEAPEVKFGVYEPEKSDIYSLGVVYYEILYGLQNFHSKTEFTYPQEQNVSEQTTTLIDMMIQEQAANRISWQQIGQFLDAIKNTQNIGCHQKYQLDESLKEKYFTLKKLLQDLKKIRKEIKDFPSENLELLLIKKLIFDFESTKLEFEKQKIELEQQLKIMEYDFEVNILELKILQNHSLRTKLNKLIIDLEKERYISLNENKELKLKLCNDYFIKHYNHLNEELFNEQSENFQQNLERGIKEFLTILQKPEYITSDNSLQIKQLRINILIIQYSDKYFEQIKDHLFKNNLITNKELSMVDILDDIKNESIADQFEQCLEKLRF